MDSPTHQRLDERCDLRHLRSCRSKQTDPEHSSSQSASVHSLSECVCAVLLPLPQWDVSKHWLLFFCDVTSTQSTCLCGGSVCLTIETSTSASSTTTGVQMCACDPHTRTHTHTHTHTRTHTHTHTHAHTHTYTTHTHSHTHTHTHTHTRAHTHTYTTHTHSHTHAHTLTHSHIHSHAHVLPSIDQLREPKDRRLNKPANSSIYLLLIKYSSVSYILIYFNFSCFDVFF